MATTSTTSQENLPMTRSRFFSLSLLATLAFVIAAVSFPAHAQPVPSTHPIIKFNVSGAGTGAGQGTIPFGIVADGSILGEYIDASGVYHGFLRSPSGAITTFDAPGAGPGQSTFPSGINSALTIVGSYSDSSSVSHGFLRSPGGSFVTIDAPGAGTGAGQGTGAYDINTKGEIAGSYYDSEGTAHGYVRSPGGTFTSFDAPGAGTGSGLGTYPAGLCGLNDAGAIAGTFNDISNVYQVYLRTPTGAFTDITPPGTVDTLIAGISSNQTVAGFYIDSITLHGFVSLNGTITSFDAPNSTATTANNINAGGTVAGDYYDTHSVIHGYVRTPSGVFTEFSVPGAGTAANQGTVAAFINSTGQITGNYIDSSGVNHGFLRQ
jgi:hypothetical protein